MALELHNTSKDERVSLDLSLTVWRHVMWHRLAYRAQLKCDGPKSWFTLMAKHQKIVEVGGSSDFSAPRS